MALGRPRIRAVASLATLLALVAPIRIAGDASAVPGFSLSRLQGVDRYDTAKAIAEAAFTTTDGAIVATGERFADALAGTYLAGQLNVPILLTGRAQVPTVTKQALANLKVKSVLILGGTAAVGAAVESDLKATDSTSAGGGKLTVNRLGGTDRYETAKMVATVPGITPGTVQGKKTALLATGEKFADALAAGPAAYSAKLPVLLTSGNPSPTLHAQAKAALQSLGIEHVLVLGGTQAITAPAENEVRNARGTGSVTTERLQGNDRTETARAVAEYSVSALGFATTHVNLARGDDPSGFADALTGGPHAGRDKAPILLTVSPTVLSQPAGTGAERFLRDKASTLTGGHLFGGPLAVSDAVKAAAEAAAGGAATTPAMVAASANPTTDVVSITYSEAVACVDDSATRAQFSFPGAGAAPTAVTCNGTTTVSLKFAAVTGGGTVTYTDDSAANDANDVKSAAGAPAKSPDSVTAPTTADTTRPQLSAASANATAETVTLTYSEPVTCADSAATRAKLSFSGATPAAPVAVVCNNTTSVSLTFSNVTAAGTVTYTDADAALDAGDVKDLSGNQAKTPDTVSATVTGDTTAPQLAAAVANPTSDAVSVTYSEPVVCSNTAETLVQFSYQGAAPTTPTDVTCNGTATVLLRFAAVTGTGSLAYTDDSAAGDTNDVRDVNGNQARSPDTVTATVTVDITAPQMTAATGNTTAATVVVTYSEPVECSNGPATWVKFSYAGATPNRPATVLCDNSTTVLLTFDAVTNASSTLTYTDATATLDAGDVRDVAGNQAKTPDQVTATPATETTRPEMSSAVANTTADVVVVTYSEPVTCADNQNTRAKFTYAGSAKADRVVCDGSTVVALHFNAVSGPGQLTYEDAIATADVGDVVDLFGNQAVSPQSVSATSSVDTSSPHMVAAVANTVQNVVTVTYSEPVRCQSSAAVQFSFTGATPAGAARASCSNSVLTLVFADVVGNGTLTYTDDNATASDPNDVSDLFGNPAITPESITATSTSDVTKPELASATASVQLDTVTVTYSEPVRCLDSAALRGKFTFQGATTASPAANVVCNGTTAVVLRFDDVAGGGVLSYLDVDAAGSTGDVTDLAGNPATSPDDVTTS